MNLWIVKNIKFGYRYTTNKSIRQTIKDYFDNFLLDILYSKGSTNDKFIIVGGLFSNTNPSIVAISDCTQYLEKISKIMNVVLITTPNDIRFFDGDNYSTLDMFKNKENINVISYNDDDFISFGECIIDVNNEKIKINDKEINIPNAIQFEEDDDEAGIFVNRLTDNKFTVVKNKYSPKHITYEIKSFDDFNHIEKDNNIIHLIIDDKLSIENKTKLNLEIFKVNPSSIKYTNNIIETKKSNITNFDIKKTIYDTIGDNDKLKEQFNRIINITKEK